MASMCAAGLLVAALVACDKSDPTASTGSMIGVTAYPTTIDLDAVPDGTSTITATVLAMDGGPETGVAVRFTTDHGTMGSSGKPNGNQVRTNANGDAVDVLTLSTGDDGATVTARSGSKTGTVDVSVGGVNAAPIARITITPSGGIACTGTTCTAAKNQAVVFSAATSTGHGGSSINHWDWTLATSLPCTGCPSDPDVADHFSGMYSAGGTVLVSLTVRDSQNRNSNEVMTTLNIANAAPMVALSASATTVPVGTPVIFTANATDDGSIVRYEWDFESDGTLDACAATACIAQEAHTYASANNYTAKVKVYDNGDGTCPSTPCTNQKNATATIPVTVQ